MVELLCEAQSALRRSLSRVGANPDPDQLAVYEWVRETSSRHRIFLKRHMRADDLAEPSDWPDLCARIESASGTDPRSKCQKQAIEAVRARVAEISAEPGDGRDWRGLIDEIEAALASGIAASSRDLRELILPLVDEFPPVEDLPEGVGRVLGALDQYLATRDRPAPSITQTTSPELEQAARLLARRSVVLIGGDRRPGPQRMLEEALNLKELVWIGTREHQSIRGFEAAIARPEVALVLLAIRWSSHAFGDVKVFCETHGKPLVRLPGGYNPNQVAAQIMSQASGQLEAK